MQENQEFTPKYWVVHDPDGDDVLLATASKNRTTAVNKYREIAHGSFPEDDEMTVSLVEIKLVHLH